MPRGKSKQNDKGKDNPNAGRKYYCEPEAAWGGYVDLKLEEDRRDAFADWFRETGDAAMHEIVDALAQGLGLGVKWDAANQCFIASFTGAGVSNSNERYVLSARSDQFSEALALLIYKHVVCMSGDWGDFRPRTGTLKQWG